jgi:peroxiredoxin
LAEYQRRLDDIRAAGADVAALSVDSPARSEALRAQLGLAFPILCDTARTVVRAWDLYNRKEMRGIAIPAVFVIGPDRRVRYRSIDRTAARVDTAGVLAFLRGAATAAAPSRRAIVPGLREIARVIANVIRRGSATPPE